MKKRVHVKPEKPYSEEWLVMELDTLENFIDDWARYGFLTALLNAWRLFLMEIGWR